MKNAEITMEDLDMIIAGNFEGFDFKDEVTEAADSYTNNNTNWLQNY